ncbi:serine/threonine-protein kinase [Jatrophihabitans sp. GAS493]|uniref:serine/threonine-protein kinase n=1 Tax=Jatrophihabitans sp. GAS493 TaxID=1907575 RepID=UPI0012FD144E|nr:serine/threonine-protein kinase [Jatrophihabitans sp. GAS493]
MTSSAPGVGTGALLASRYRLRERVGRGGMADVFAAADELLHRPVAVKVFRFDSPAVDDQRRVEAEMRTLAGLRHPNLVTVFDAGSVHEGPEATPYIVMELITGPTLGQRIAQAPLIPDQVRLLGSELAATLAYVHGKGIVHRDIKPANVLLDTPNIGGSPFSAKLTDFGIAVLLDSTRFTMAGMTVGTANYLSPEQVQGGQVTPASDVYPLGLVLLECLTGRLAYPGPGVEAALARLSHQPDIPAYLPAGWRQLLTAMTAFEASARPSAADVAHQLAGLIERSEPPNTAYLPDPADRDHPTALASSATARLAGVEDPARSTQLLAALPSTDQSGNDLSGNDLSGNERGDSRRPGEPARWSRRWLGAPAWIWLTVAIGSLVLIGAIVFAVNRSESSSRSPGSSSGSSSSPQPSYPAVPGNVGVHLRQLEGAVG